MKKLYLITTSLLIISPSISFADSTPNSFTSINNQTITSQTIEPTKPQDPFVPAESFTSTHTDTTHTENITPSTQTQTTPSDDPFTPANTFTSKKTIKTHYPNGIAAIVEDHIITVDDVQRKVLPFVQLIQREALNEQQFIAKLDEVGKEVLERMIDDRLLINKFNSNKKAKIPQTYLDMQYHKYIDEQFNGDRSQYNQYLKAQGISDRQFRKRQKEEVILAVVRNELRKMQSEISPDKIQKYYDSHPNQFKQEDALHLQQIMLTPPQNTPTEQINTALTKKAEPILNKLNSGMPFTDIAKKYSEDDMKNSGGDWGWINREDIHPKLANIAFQLPKGTHSKLIIHNNHGFILYAKDSKKKGLVPIEEVRNQIESIIANNLVNEAQEAHLQVLRKKSHIKRFI